MAAAFRAAFRAASATAPRWPSVHSAAGGFDGSAQRLEEMLFTLDGLLLCAEHPFFVVLEFLGDVPFGVLERLLAVETDGNVLHMGVGDFDVVAEHLVVADLQRGNAGLLGQASLVLGQPCRAVALQTPVLIEFGIDAIGDESAFTQVGRWFIHAAVDQFLTEGRGDPRRLRQPLVDRGERGIFRKQFNQIGQGAERPAQCDQIPWCRATHGDPSADACDILHAGDDIADAFAAPLLVDESFDRIESGFDGGPISKRVAQPVPKPSAAHGRTCLLQHGQHRAVGRSGSHRAFEFQAPHRGRIKGHSVVPMFTLRGFQMREPRRALVRCLRFLQKSEYGTGNRKGGVRITESPAFQACDVPM